MASAAETYFKTVSSEVEDARQIDLAQHDKDYHGGYFDNDAYLAGRVNCSLRDEMKNGDLSDSQITRTLIKEKSIKDAVDGEEKDLLDAFREAFPSLEKPGVFFFPGDLEYGSRNIDIFWRYDRYAPIGKRWPCHASDFPKHKVAGLLEKLGYKLESMNHNVMGESDYGSPAEEHIYIRASKEIAPGTYAEKNRFDQPMVRQVKENMTESRMNELLKKYGYGSAEKRSFGVRGS